MVGGALLAGSDHSGPTGTTQPEAPTWLGAVFGLQQKSKSFHPGGGTALELAGLARFLPLGDAHPVDLFSRPSDRLPSWFKRLALASRVQHVSTNFLPPDLGLREHRAGALGVSVSAPERAALEFLQHLTLDEGGGRLRARESGLRRTRCVAAGRRALAPGGVRLGEDCQRWFDSPLFLAV